MKPKKQLVSIIVTTYNRAGLVIETLQSIQNQTYFNFECIVIDDGSIDDTELVISSFIKKDNRFRFYKRPITVPKGHCYCRNFGFELSKGEFINWFDDDDIMHPECIEKKVIKLNEKKCDFVSCEIAYFVNEIKNNTPISNDYSKDMILQNYYIGKISFYSVCALWKKSFLNNNKLKYIEKNKPLEDWFFNINALLTSKNRNYDFIKEVLVYYRRHTKTISANLSNFNTNLIYQEFLMRREVYVLYSNNNLLNYEIYKFYLNRLRYLLRALLVKKDDRSIDIFKEYLKTFHENKIFLNKRILTILGYFSYKFFGKGYFLLTDND